MNCQELLNKHKIKNPKCISNIPKGWLPLVEQLIIDLINAGWDRDLHQVKDKFGGLRFYIGNSSKKMCDIIDKAESKSNTICMECGEDIRTSTNECCGERGYWVNFYDKKKD